MKRKWLKVLGWIFVCGFALEIANAWIAGPDAFILGIYASIGMTFFGIIGFAMGVLLIVKKW
jgi:hypothetical protein